MGGKNPRGDKRKREWVHSESVTSHRNLSIYPHCVDFPAANKKESFVSNRFLKALTRNKAAKKGTVDLRMVRIRNMMNTIPKTFITSEQPILKLTQGVRLHRKGNLMVRIRITYKRQPFVYKRCCTKKKTHPILQLQVPILTLVYNKKNMVFDLNTTFSRSVWLKHDSNCGLNNKHLPAQR